MKVALVHDWLTGYRGGERVLAALCAMYPQADVFTLVHVPGSVGHGVETHKIVTSFVQRMPRAKVNYRHYLPLFPLAIEAVDLGGYELVVSTSHAVAKGCRPAPGAVHVSYVHTPMRYVWDQFDAYFGPGRAGPLVRAAAHAVAPALRGWDVRSTARIDRLIANSRFVSERCARFWNRPADAVVYPPVEIDDFTPAMLSPDERSPTGRALIVSALVPYKRVDLAIRAFAQAKRRLLIVGDGPELNRLRALVNELGEPARGIELVGPVSFERLAHEMAHASFFLLPGEEDFGIAPVEAQAAGRPVLALGKGGARETVLEGRTGAFFAEPTIDSLLAALPAIDQLAQAADPKAIRAHAATFAAARFAPELQAQIDLALNARAK